MQTPIVRQFRDDVLNKNPENQIRGEPFTTETPGIYTRVIVPKQSPFFIKSLKLYFLNGEPMTEDHWEIYKIMPGLTSLAAQGVACMIRLKDPDIVEGLLDYDVVGEFTLFDTAMMNLVVTATEDDRMIDFFNLKNRPIVYPPVLHPHSLLYDIMAFQDTIHLLNSISAYSEQLGTPLIETKISQYFSNFNHYLALYKSQLMKFLADHKSTYNEHGIKAIQVGLEKVDNFATAVEPMDLLGGRDDMHLTVQGLATIVNQTGFDSGEYLIKGSLPISQFGNTNFIPPSIDGSFEGLGGISETAGICLESDGSVTYLWNRMDGRVNGLYYSVLTGLDTPAAELTYTGFKYEHPRFNVDGSSVNRIAQGSGDEVILVGDTNKEIYYIGMTNGSLDPFKHVYSKINLRPLLDKIYTNPASLQPSLLFPWLSIAKIGDWIYIFHSTSVNAPAARGTFPEDYNLGYKFIYRVAVADVKATIDVTPALQNMSFIDADGVQVTNSPWFRWYTTTRDGSGNVIKGLSTFNPAVNGFLGNYRVAITLAAENPNRPGIFALKFLCGWYASHVASPIGGAVNFTTEINYDLDPSTNVMTFTSKTNMPPVAIDQTPKYPESYNQSWPMYLMAFQYQNQSINIFDNGVVMGSASTGFSGFPRNAYTNTSKDLTNRFTATSRLWGLGKDFVNTVQYEKIASPMASSINSKSVLFQQGGEYYVAASRTDINQLQLFWKSVSGKFAVRPTVSNLFYPNIQSRPLSSAVRTVNAPPGLGGVCVSVPSANLDAYGTEVGESAWCMGTTTSRFNRTYSDPSGQWRSKFTTTGASEEILLISTANQQIEDDGTMTIVPVTEVSYPANIVQQLKNEVQNLGILNGGTFSAVTISDPTFSSLPGRFGWLPVVVGVTYRGVASNTTLYTTFMTIQPTYSAQGSKQVVTGYTVTNKIHWSALNSAISPDSIRVFNGPTPGGPNSAVVESTVTTHGPMRCYYYLEGNTVSVYFTPAVMSTVVSDALTSDLYFSITDRRNGPVWNYTENFTRTSRGGGPCMTPDNGISFILDWQFSTGGAGTLQDGRVYKALVGSVYPEVGWIIFFKSEIKAVFYGKEYTLPAGTVDLRDIDSSPGNKVFYVYAMLKNEIAIYDITQEKRLESPSSVWAAKVTTNASQILTIERFNVFTINGSRISEIKRGNSIPASSGLVNVEGQIPWLRSDEMLP